MEKINLNKINYGESQAKFKGQWRIITGVCKTNGIIEGLNLQFKNELFEDYFIEGKESIEVNFMFIEDIKY